MRQVYVLKRDHGNFLWQPADSKETDDFVMRLLVKVTRGLVAPGPRKRGSFKTPEAWAVEPIRTESLINSVLWCCKPQDSDTSPAFKAGKTKEQLASWLGGSGGSMTYKLGVVLIQMAITFFIAMFTVVKDRSDTLRDLAFILIMLLQGGMTYWHLYGEPVDRLNALLSALVSSIELLATGLVWASALLADDGNAGTAEALGLVTPNLMMVAVFLPVRAARHPAMNSASSSSCQPPTLHCSRNCTSL
jgi:hypothetical protein